MSGVAVFAYGSLVDPTSASQTLGRQVKLAETARLEGWARRWTLARDNRTAEKTFALAGDGSLPSFCVGLNLEPDPGAPGPNGVLIEVTERELDRLDLREMRYQRVEVTEAIRTDAAEPGFETVIAYRGRPEYHHPSAPPGAILIASYLATVETAFDALGPGQLELFRATTGPPPVEVVEATLVRDRIPAGNPRRW